jgi:hypothetical protein
MNTTTVDTVVEKDHAIEAVIRLFIHTDNRDWKKVKALFTQCPF